MSRPRLVVATARAPWPTMGGFPLRVAHLLPELERDWDISLLVASPMDESAARWSHPERHEIFTTPADDPEALRVAAARIVRDRDPGAALLFPGTGFLAGEVPGLPRTVADRIDSGTLERLRYIRCSRRLRRSLGAVAQAGREAWYERRLARRVAAVTVVGEDDAGMIRRISGVESVHVVPNGVAVVEGPAFEREHPRPTVVFTGTLDYYANEDACRYLIRRIWPRIRGRVDGGRLVLAGRRPGRRLRELADAYDVEVLPEVPDMFAVLREGWVAVAPMRCGTGVKNKVLEAWAVGRPVVVTSLGANGLALDDQARDLVVDDPHRFADTVARLLEDTELRRAYGNAARDLARSRHSWRESADTLTGLLFGSVEG